MTFIPAQQPDGSVGRRYAKAFKYVFAMFRTGEVISLADSAASAGSVSSIIDDGRFVSLTLLQEIQLRAPFATVVTPMQDGGKVIESRGQVLRVGSVSGTTGFLPPNTAVPLQSSSGRLVPNVADLDGQLGAISGYLAFRRLRYLFELYGDERRRGNLDVVMCFFDYKNDDFWRIEPDSFDVHRSSRRPMTSDYSIPFKCIERIDAVAQQDDDALLGIRSPFAVGAVGVGGALAKVADATGSASRSAILATVARFADMTTSGLDFLKNCDAVVQRAFQATLTKLDAVVGFFADIHDTFFELLGLAPTLLAQLSASLVGLFSTINEFAPDNIAQEINAWALEVTVQADRVAVQVNAIVQTQSQRDVRDTDQRFSQGRMKQGARTDLMQEPAGGSGAPDADPFIGRSGLSLVTDVDGIAGASQRSAVVIHNGEDVYALARRTLGRSERFVDIVLLNKLEFPYIVASSADKPPNTLAWGELAVVPASGVSTTAVPGAPDAPAVPTAAGTVDTASLPSQLTDSTSAWLPDQWVGYSVTVTTGALQQTLVCRTNTATQLTLNGNWTIAVTPGVTTYAIAYATFEPAGAVTAETRAYGVDILAVFDADGRCDATLDATSDLATVQGFDNLVQAITLRARCPVGEHPFHPTYGLLAPVGRPFTDDVSVLYSFLARMSLLADPRISRVRNVQLSEVGDKVTLSAEVQPINARAASPIAVQVGG